MLSFRRPYVPAFAPRRSLEREVAHVLVGVGMSAGARAAHATHVTYVHVGDAASMTSASSSASSPSMTDLGAYVIAPIFAGAFFGFLFGGLLPAAILATVAGAGGAVVLARRGPSASGTTPGNPTGAVLHGKIVACLSTHAAGSPGQNPGMMPLVAHVQSNPLFEWCYVVGPGDTAGSIAAAIVGDEARYQELVLANAATHGTIGVPGKVGADEWNFTPEAMVQGTTFAIPQTWDPHIDPFGTPKGTRDPWPEDPRLLSGVSGTPSPGGGSGEPGVKVEGYDVTNYSPDGEFVHYGAPA